jgi:hypothetical protein
MSLLLWTADSGRKSTLQRLLSLYSAALKNLCLIALLGNHLIVPHLAAIAEMMVLAVVLIAWISRVFPLVESAVGVTTAMALYIFCMDGETLGGLHRRPFSSPY